MERKIVIGLIVSTDFLDKIRPEINIQYFASDVGRILAGWCLDHYDEFHKAIGKDIETVYWEALKQKKISKDLAEEIEDDILPDLSDEYVKTGLDDFLYKSSLKWCKERRVEILKQQIEQAQDKGDTDTAERLIEQYKTTTEIDDELVFGDVKILDKVKTAFENTYTPLINYPGALGEFWNSQMVQGGFVALLSPEKRGKSWFLIDAVIRAVRQGNQVAFFQAGDMTASQQLRRISIYLARKSDKERYCGKQFIPVKDCIRNQLNLCNKGIREVSFGIFEGMGWNDKDIRKEVSFDALVQAYKDDPSYSPCFNCEEFNKKSLGAIWIKEVDLGSPVTYTQAQTLIDNYFVRRKRDLRISTHPNGTLTIPKIKQILNSWKIRDGFTPKVISIDYADLLDDPTSDFRQRQNQIWKGLRAISQEYDCLVLTVTQSDAASYEKDSLSLSNFSEDKRKFAHVTAFYGMNQDKHGREKKMGILRLNELLLREDEFDTNRQVTVLQSLKIGRPVLDSYF